MSTNRILPGAEPFFFEGSDVGCLVSQGFTATPDSVRFLGEFLAREGGLTVLGPRLSGHGTVPEDLAKSTVPDWIRDIEHATDELRARCSRLFMAGLSMGGTLTLYTAGMRPDLFAGIVPMNAAIFVNSPEFASLAFAAEAPAAVPGIASDIKKPGVEELAYPVVPVPALRHLFGLLAVTRELLPRVVSPTLVVQSREDHVVPPENGPYILDHIGAKKKRLVWLENSYHVATMDHDKERLASEILRFIRAQL